MDYLISHTSAIEIWKRLSESGQIGSFARNTADDALSLAGKPDYVELARKTRRLFGLKGPIDLIIPDSCLRRISKDINCHLWSEPLPSGSCYRIAPDIYLSSPEFAFLQMAGELTPIQLMQLGFELCGCYVTGSQYPRGFMRTHQPITSCVALGLFLGTTDGRYGGKKARHALRWILDNSWSPMESDISLLLCLPAKMGGYQLPAPLLNRRMRIPEHLARAAGTDRYYLDLSWGNDVALEYNGEADHFDRAQASRDRAREIVIRNARVSLIVVTSQQVFRSGQFELVVQELCDHLGRRYHPATESRLAKRAKLRSALFERFGPDTLVG